MDKTSVNLLEDFKNGNKTAFKEIYDQYASSIFDVANKILRDGSLAEEIVQESFLRLWLNRENVNPNLAIWPYLYVACKRLCFNAIRDLAVARKALDTLEYHEVNDVEEKVHYNELQQQLQVYVDSLPDQQRRAWILSREEGLSHQQIALEMDISKNTVKNHIGQALKSLRENLSVGDYTFLLISILFL